MSDGGHEHDDAATTARHAAHAHAHELRKGHAHGHAHAHSHGHTQEHGHAHGASQRQVGIAALVTGAFMLVEVAGGIVSGSLALLADAGHMLTDCASLVLAWYGFRLARRPADWRRTYGWDRFAVLAAFTNGLALFAIAGSIALEAWHRLRDPAPVAGPLMLAVALAGLAVNVVAFVILSRGDRASLNVRGALLHVAGDLLGSVAAIVAALVILATGWQPIDPLLSVLVAVIILRSAKQLVAEAGHILLEGAPAGVDTREVAADLEAHVAGVAKVHHVHAWSISESRRMITLNVRVADGAAAADVVAAIKTRLADRFGVDHATVESESVVISSAGHDANCR